VSLTVGPFQPPLAHHASSNWSVLAQNSSKFILYRKDIIGNEMPSQTPKSTTPPPEKSISNFYQSYRTVPYYSTTYDVSPYVRTRQH